MTDQVTPRTNARRNSESECMSDKTIVRNLPAALECAQDICLMICRCGHTESEHLTNKIRPCDAEGCGCWAFYPAPLRVELEGRR